MGADKAAVEKITLQNIHEKLAAVLVNCEANLKTAVNELESKGDIGQTELLAIQTKIQAWGNMCSTITGLLRAVGDSLKSTTQNIR